MGSLEHQHNLNAIHSGQSLTEEPEGGEPLGLNNAMNEYFANRKEGERC